jgi:DNA-binding transcriptional ArsR family regulator
VAKKERVVITDPRAIRALAHPARQRIIDELYNGRVLTATECAEMAGLTPSAMSYHLRALERWGIIERAEASGDGRERPWRAPAGSLEITSQSTGAGRLASQAMMRTSVERVMEHFAQMAGDDPWDDVSTYRTSQVWLTHNEAKRFTKDLHDLFDRYKKGRTATSHPADSRQVSTLLAVVPTGKPPDNEA